MLTQASSLLDTPLHGSENRRINERGGKQQKERTLLDLIRWALCVLVAQHHRSFLHLDFRLLGGLPQPFVFLWAEFENDREREGEGKKRGTAVQ